MTKTGPAHKMTSENIRDFRECLLRWYDRNRRTLPWRAPSGERPNPYYVWLSEIMLQQTTVTAVIPYFIKFIGLWPDIHALAKAPQEEIMNAWAGLGYYARARNLHACAKIVSQELGGFFPRDQAALKNLPGIGDYTSAAIRAIAFDKPATVVDGNIERIMARYFAVHKPLPDTKPQIKHFAGAIFKDFEDRPGDLAQALMDLGAAICIPKAPRCMLCPLSHGCTAYRKGVQDTLPRKRTKKARPKKYGYVYWLMNENRQVLLEKRPEKGLLGGMTGLPTSEWSARQSDVDVQPGFLNIGQDITPHHIDDTPVHIHHSFTHFELELQLRRAQLEKKALKQPQNYFWEKFENIEEYGFPTVFQKAVNIFRKSHKV